MDQLLRFLKSQRILMLACTDEKAPWVANVYFGINDDFKMYFISPTTNKHSQLIEKNPHIAFSTVWFDSGNHANRKAVQGIGICRLAKDEHEIEKGVALHNENYPEFKERITVDWIHTNQSHSRVWVIEPSYMKYWDDEIYKDNETEEFHF